MQGIKNDDRSDLSGGRKTGKEWRNGAALTDREAAERRFLCCQM